MVRCFKRFKILFFIACGLIAASIICCKKSKLPPLSEEYERTIHRSEPNESKAELPFCQRTDQFLLFKDKFYAGLLHKMDDFIDAAYMAVKSNRTLVSYIPSMQTSHQRDNNNVRLKVSTGNFFFHGWTWGDMLDTKQFVYQKFDQSGSQQVCRLRVLPASYLRNNFGSTNSVKSVVTIEYGEYSGSRTRKLKRFFRIRNITTDKMRNLQNSDIKNLTLISKQRSFSLFITTAADYVKNFCLKRSFEKVRLEDRELGSIERFIVIHLRGSDRPCAMRSLKPTNLTSSLEKFGVRRESDVVYVMSDLSKRSPHLKELKTYFSQFYLFQAKDIPIFEDPVFAKKAPFLIYVTEHQLQDKADAIVLTYPGHRMRDRKKILGSLAPDKCIR
ncbi:uncharacterized protein LOC142337281 isoform X2 [Convolutriloba macropyga]|uniref:uncharacterized protein LOC142337281 isoform X2 n=1 Tax=Convolutriloba macropyga TaxID=536237 RepID=UPI003F51E42C